MNWSAIPMPWGVLLSFVVVGVAYFCAHGAAHIFDEEDQIWWVAGVFLVFFAAMAYAIWLLTPPLDQPADVRGLVQGILNGFNLKR